MIIATVRPKRASIKSSSPTLQPYPIKSQRFKGQDKKKRKGKAHHADVVVDGDDAFVGGGLEHLGGDNLLHGKDNTVLASQSNGRARKKTCQSDRNQ